LINGQLAFFGGEQGLASGSSRLSNNFTMFNLDTYTTSTAKFMNAGEVPCISGHTATLLANNQIVILGSPEDSEYVNNAENCWLLEKGL
jgi:hypothetical protein